MKKLNNQQRKYLKGKAHHLEPVLIIGKNGINDGAVELLNGALEARELVKIKFGEFKSEKKQLSIQLEKLTNCQLVSIIGHVLILFRQNPDPSKQIYTI